MIEDEALTKWCPFARVAISAETKRLGEQPVGSANRLEALGAGVADFGWPAPRCIGSECMAWRWAPKELNAGARRGHCGLAGRP